MNKSRLFLILLFTPILMCCTGIYFLCTSTVSQEEGAIYYLRPGTTKKTLVADLSRQGIIKHSMLFTLYVSMQRNAYLKTGEYRFVQGTTPVALWRQVVQGKGLVYRPFTIIPGWTFVQLKQALAQAMALRHLIQTRDDQQVMTDLGYAHLQAEGQFFPETYYYTRGVSDLAILQRAILFMQEKLQAAWQNRAPGLPYRSKYQVLIAASLVEKEAHLNEERPLIAGVLVNRLRKKMLLQFDPTVIYGLGQRYDGKIHRQNLQEKTAYNTYVHKGLPPTPIAIPSMESIQATLHPKKHSYLYFVARGDGSHQFSTTLKAHHRAVIMSNRSLKDRQYVR
jgi:UPF0755 protein